MIRALLVIGTIVFFLGGWLVSTTHEWYGGVLAVLGVVIFIAGIGTFLQDLVKSRKP